MDIFEWDGLLFLNTNGEDNGFYFVIWIVRWFAFIFSFDFLLRFELWEIVKVFSTDHGFVGIEFKFFMIGNSISESLNFVDSEFFDFVAIEEKWQFNKVVFVWGDFLVEEFVMSEIFVTKVVIDLLGNCWGHVYVLDCKQQVDVI